MGNCSEFSLGAHGHFLPSGGRKCTGGRYPKEVTALGNWPMCSTEAEGEEGHQAEKCGGTDNTWLFVGFFEEPEKTLQKRNLRTGMPTNEAFRCSEYWVWGYHCKYEDFGFL